jgi:ABC-type transport system substrate-binding protein
MRRPTLLVALLLLAACTEAGEAVPESSTTSTAVATTIAPTTTSPSAFFPSDPVIPTPTDISAGGTVVLSVDVPELPFSFNPWAQDHSFDPVIGQAYLTGVWDIDAETMGFVPDVVTELPTVANNGVVLNDDGSMTVTYNIVPEAQWANGTPITGADFDFTYETITGLELNDPNLSIYEMIDPESIIFDDTTFTYTLSAPTMAYERLFGVLVPQHAVAGTDFMEDWNNRPWPSGGPFTFRGWSTDSVATVGSLAIFDRNDQYWKTDESGDPLPYLSTVEFRFTDGLQGRIDGFVARELDVIDLAPAADVLSSLQHLDGAAIQLSNGATWEHLSFQLGENNANSASLNASADFRRAVAYAIDRNRLAVAGGWVNEGTLSSFFEILGLPMDTEGWDRYDYDPELAGELLQDACAAMERNCTFNPPVVVLSTTSTSALRLDVAAEIETMLAAVGIDFRCEPSDDFYTSLFPAGSWDLALFAFPPQETGWDGVIETLAFWDPAGPPPSGLNYARWGTPAVENSGSEFDQGASTVVDANSTRYEEILTEMRITVDTERLEELAAEAEEILADQAIIIPIAARSEALAYWSDEIAGIRANASAATFTWNIESWHRVDA